MASERKSDLPPDQSRLAELAKQYDEELAALRARFDQYFLGLEKKNPIKELDDFRKRLLKLKGEFIRNTALKFRVQTLYQKFQSYERLWLKSLKEIEDGTYARDLFKLRRRKGGRGDEPQPEKKKDAAAEDAPPRKDVHFLDDPDLEADLPAELFGDDEPAAPPPRPAAPPPPPAQAVAARPATPPPPPAQAVAARQATPPPPPPAQVAARQATPPPPPAAAVAARPATPPPPPAAAVAARPATPPPPPASAVAARPAAPPPPPREAMPPPRPAAARPPPPPAAATAGEGLSNDKIKKIYDAFISAKKQCKESTTGLTMDAVAQSLRKQVPQLIKEHGASSVDFKVVIKDGKAVLKAVPK